MNARTESAALRYLRDQDTRKAQADLLRSLGFARTAQGWKVR